MAFICSVLFWRSEGNCMLQSMDASYIMHKALCLLQHKHAFITDNKKMKNDVQVQMDLWSWT